MKRRVMTRLILVASLAYVGLAVLLPGTVPAAETDLNDAGFGSVETLMTSYNDWEATYAANGGDRRMTISLGPAKGLATTSSTTHGRMVLDLLAGTISVEVAALPEGTWEVWLIENRPGPGRSVLPEPGDRRLRLGNLDRQDGMATLDVSLGRAAFAQFDPDLVTVTRAGSDPANDRLLVGAATLFQRLYRSGQRGQFGRLSHADEPERPASDRTLRWLFASVSPTAYAQIGPIPDPTTALEQLITRGRRSFFTDTFGGNGRTCGTCHREDRNLTIDPDFIATLPPNDPLFVAEFVPALMCDDPVANTGCKFENPVLMRQFGLILENQDGFDDLANKFNMRGVPHTLALLQNTLTPANVLPFPDGTIIPPNERTGWSGDGAPGAGTLREFIVGAVTQHYPKTLNRTPGVDFVVPTVGQMDALEAFQRSLGRRQDLVLTGPGALRLRSAVAAKGQDLFNDPTKGKCFGCHLNAGASVDGIHNANFNTGVENLRSQPADLLVPAQLNPPDGGFGTAIGASGFGNGTFNTTVLVEAADTGPFFHNNAIRTIEGAVAFYTGPAFNNSPGAVGIGFLPGGNGPGIELDSTEVEAVAAFLRVINALENLRSARSLATRLRNAATTAHVRQLSELLRAELTDAYTVLNGAGLHAPTQQKLGSAIAVAEKMIALPGRNLLLIAQALALIDQSVQELRE